MSELNSERISNALARCEDGRIRCNFNIDNPNFREYHDTQFGRPTRDDQKIFEKICIEGFASGLSLITVLNRWSHFRDRFANFDIATVASMGNKHIDAMMEDARLIRNRAKLGSVINNARCARELIEQYGSLAAFLWSYEPEPTSRPVEFTLEYLKEHPSSPNSARMAKVMRDQGWSYIGPVTVYGVMQGMGVVNDHFEGCEFRDECEQERKVFKIPTII